MEFQIVVARYNEDLTWLNPLRHYATVYNKGPALEGTIQLPNVGREAHTYLTHIVNNYDTLADVTCFIQGRIDDHCDGRNPLESIQRWGGEAKHIGRSMNCARPLDYISGFFPTFKIIHWRGETHDSGMNLSQFWTKHTSKPFPELFSEAYYGACFAVRRERIIQWPKSVWQSLLDSVSHSRAPEEGHFMERLWAVLFRGPCL